MDERDTKFRIELRLQQRLTITGTLQDLHVYTGIPMERLAEIVNGEDIMTDDEDTAIWIYLGLDNLLDGDRVTLELDTSSYELRRADG